MHGFYHPGSQQVTSCNNMVTSSQGTPHIFFYLYSTPGMTQRRHSIAILAIGHTQKQIGICNSRTVLVSKGARQMAYSVRPPPRIISRTKSGEERSSVLRLFFKPVFSEHSSVMRWLSHRRGHVPRSFVTSVEPHVFTSRYSFCTGQLLAFLQALAHPASHFFK